MCISPIYLPDKSHNITIENKVTGKSRTIEVDRYGIHKSQYMPVPCGHCKQCIAIAQMEMIQRIQMESLDKDIYMITCTYDNEHLPRLVTSEGYEYRYADYKDASFMIERMRENKMFGDREFKWLIVSERGSHRARPHFHILLLFKREEIGKTLAEKYQFEQDYKWKILDYWERPYYRYFEDDKGRIKSKIDHYEKLCKYVESYKYGKKRATYDFHYVNPNPAGITNAAFYVLKYMMKDSTHEEKIRQALWTNYEEEEAKKYWETIKSRREYSLGFGLGVDFTRHSKECCNKDNKNCDKCRQITKEVSNPDIINYLRRCINDSKREKLEFAHYFSPEELSTFPLANYYKNFGFIYNRDDEDYFYKMNPDNYRKRYLTPEHKTRSELQKILNDWEKIVKLQEMEDIADDYDKLLENS